MNRWLAWQAAGLALAALLIWLFAGSALDFRLSALAYSPEARAFPLRDAWLTAVLGHSWLKHLGVLLWLPVRLVPAAIDVRKESYGIYLVHEVVGVTGRGLINAVAGRNPSGESLFVRLPEIVSSPVARIELWFLWSAAVYLASLALVKALRETPFAWVAGFRDREERHAVLLPDRAAGSCEARLHPR